MLDAEDDENKSKSKKGKTQKQRNMKKNILIISATTFVTLLAIIITIVVIKYNSKPQDDFNGLKTYIQTQCNKNNSQSIKIYEDIMYNSYSEFEAFLRVEDSKILYSAFTFNYEDYTKSKQTSNIWLNVEYKENCKTAEYKYYYKDEQSGILLYSNGVIDIDKYYLSLMSSMIHEKNSNLTTPPESSINLHLTILKKYLNEHGFSLKSVGYINAKNP